MFLKDTLSRILADQRPPAPEGEVARTLSHQIPVRSSQALVLTGVRRSGKSVIQAQIMRRHGTTFYCNLEDTRLYGLGPADFPTFLAVVEESTPRGAPVFLDEVQEVPEWQRLVRSLLDRERVVCVTGSNASLLGRELGAKLTGRHLSFEVFPFSYPEFLAATAARSGAESLTAYLDHGGFPAYVRERDPQILQELLRDIVLRDITVRHRVRQTRPLMNLALFLLANTGRPYSLHSLTKALAIPTVAQTSRLVEHLQDAYLVLPLPKFSPSFKRRIVAPNKYYVIDNGMRRAASPQFTLDVGHRLENAVFLALRRSGRPLFYAGEKDSWECDFVTDQEAIQVCAQLTPYNQDREIAGLLGACALPGKRRPLVLTMDQRDTIAADGRAIEVKPAWQWLTESP